MMIEEKELPPLKIGQLEAAWSDVCQSVKDRSLPLGTVFDETVPLGIRVRPDDIEIVDIALMKGTGFHLAQLGDGVHTVREALYEVTGRRVYAYFVLGVEEEEVKIPPTGRQQNKEDRQKRREVIKGRWNARWTKRQIEQEAWIRPDLPVLGTWEKTSPDRSKMVTWLLRQKDELGNTLESVVEAMNEEQAKTLLAYLLRVVELKEMDYQDFLQTDEWKALATWTKTKDVFYGRQCALDVTHSSEHAHHRTYKRRGREYLSDLVPLCSECHAKFHNKTPR